jgi:FkbM family methyltransferase
MKEKIIKILPNPIKEFLIIIRNYILKLISPFYIKFYRNKIPPLILRKNRTDLLVFRNIYMLKELKVPTISNPKLIIDGGAYTGLSSLYFSLQFPEATILAIEPNNQNFNILKKNTKNNPQIKPIKAGLWHNNSKLKVLKRETGDWGFITKEVKNDENYDIKGITINKLLNQTKFEQIDILKLDIEGAEKELFSINYKTWIKKVKIIMIELHDRIKPNCTKKFNEAIDYQNWYKYKNREKVLIIRKNF